LPEEHRLMLWLLCAAVIIGIGAYLFERWEGRND
jgi:hypothetical protein